MSGSTRVLSTAEQLRSRLAPALDIFQAEAETAERLRRPTPATQRALRESEVFTLTVPAELGGIDASPLEVLDVVSEVAYADASIGWLLIALHTETARAAVELDDAAAARVFMTEDPPLIAGPAAPVGSARRVGDTLVVSGSWKLASGLPLASHVRVSVRIDDDVVVVLLPRETLAVSDNWNVLGLRASAGLDFTCDDVPVAADFITNGTVLRGGAFHRLSPALTIGLNQAAWAFGVGRRLLDELAAHATERTESAAASFGDEFYVELGRGEARLRSSRALLNEVWSQNEILVDPGGSLPVAQVTLSHLAHSQTVRTAREIGALVHRFAGPAVIRDGVLQRFFRDVHAGMMHRGSSAVVTENCGRMFAGAQGAGYGWNGFDLVAPMKENP
ncbi:MAG: acyl-CoA dehydrogenase family protein [Microbacterium sp.]|uniref:acyl-CoA dehydrogenase family protein n=1 Tax=Microbacterium sp. TaxID=51671 RepID=UPI003F7D5E69